MDDSFFVVPTPTAIIVSFVIGGVLLGGAGGWIGAEHLVHPVLKGVAALVGAVAGGGIGFVVGVIVAVAFIGSIVGLVIGIVAFLCGKYFFSNESDLLVFVPLGGGAAVGAIVGLFALLKAFYDDVTSKSKRRIAAQVLGFAGVIAMAAYFWVQGVNLTLQHQQEKRELQAQQEQQEKQAARKKLEAAVTTPTPIPDSLSANVQGSNAYRIWHQTVQLLQEFNALVTDLKSASGWYDAADCTIEELAALAVATDEPDVKDSLNSIKDALAADKKERQLSASRPMDNGLLGGWDSVGRNQSAQKRADDSRTRLSQRYGVEFARLPFFGK